MDKEMTQAEWEKLNADMLKLIESGKQRLEGSKPLFEYFKNVLNFEIVEMYGEQLEQEDNGWMKYTCYVKPQG